MDEQRKPDPTTCLHTDTYVAASCWTFKYRVCKTCGAHLPGRHEGPSSRSRA